MVGILEVIDFYIVRPGEEDGYYLGSLPAMDLPLGLRNNNPGNIRPGPQKWVGEIGANGGFVVYDTMPHGVRALAKNLIAYQKHDDGKGGKIDTVREAITRWAPPADHNDTEAYIALVCTVLNCNEDDEFNFSDPDFLYWMVTAIGEEEQGHAAFTSAVSDADIETGIQMALNGSVA